MNETLKRQEGGNHYKGMAIQPVEFIVANAIPYREANAIKYICRHSKKNGKQDILKAIHYLEMILADYEDNEELVKEAWEGSIQLDRPIEAVSFFFR